MSPTRRSRCARRGGPFQRISPMGDCVRAAAQHAREQARATDGVPIDERRAFRSSAARTIRSLRPRRASALGSAHPRHLAQSHVGRLVGRREHDKVRDVQRPRDVDKVLQHIAAAHAQLRRRVRLHHAPQVALELLHERAQLAMRPDERPRRALRRRVTLGLGLLRLLLLRAQRITRMRSRCDDQGGGARRAGRDSVRPPYEAQRAENMPARDKYLPARTLRIFAIVHDSLGCRLRRRARTDRVARAPANRSDCSADTQLGTLVSACR